MPHRLLSLALAALLACAVAPSAQAQRKAGAADPCKTLLKERAEAEKLARWSELARLAKDTQFRCESLTTSTEALVATRRDLATGLMNAGRASEALAAADQCLRLDVREPSCYLARARELANRGETESARESYRRAIQHAGTAQRDIDVRYDARRELADLNRNSVSTEKTGHPAAAPTGGRAATYFRHWHAERGSGMVGRQVIVVTDLEDDDPPVPQRPVRQPSSAPAATPPGAIDRNAASVLSTVPLPPGLPGQAPPPLAPPLGMPGALPGQLPPPPQAGGLPPAPR